MNPSVIDQEELHREGTKPRAVTVDLRSDTVTKPTPEMRRAMAEAEVGDDVYGEDPTVNRLEQRAAEIFGREAALFVPTGSMGNTIAIAVLAKPGQEVICEERTHLYSSEMGTMVRFCGCVPRLISAPDGILTWQEIRKHIAEPAYDHAQTGLIALENTHNLAGGTVYPPEVSDEICDSAHDAGLPVFLDGARIFNAAVALGKTVGEITRKFDSVMFCLSKGLGAPVGSMVVGSRAFIDEARIVRKTLGGGMRQAGVLAAAGLVALEKMPARLQDDHANARYLAEGLAHIHGIRLDASKVVTNIVFCDIRGTGTNSGEFTRRMATHNILANTAGPDAIRFVTHMDVDRAGCERALEVIEKICGRG